VVHLSDAGDTGKERLTHVNRTEPITGLVSVRLDAGSGAYLKTLGSVTLIGTPPTGSVPLRTKDLALLVYLCVNGPRKHSRSALATLLWGDRDEVRARHSLTQALRRLRLRVGGDALAIGDRVVEWRGRLACDALELERTAVDPAAAEPGLPFYGGDFLVDLAVSPGAGGFSAWADERRAHFRFAAARVLAAQGRIEEELARWDAALQLGLRLIEIEPMSQQAHRRVMRAWSELGERALAVRHYRQFEQWLRDEWGELPDPATRVLFDELRTYRSPDHATISPQDVALTELRQRVVSNDGGVRSPLQIAERPGRTTSWDAPTPLPNTPRAHESAMPVFPPETPVVASASTLVRREFVVGMTVVVVTAALAVAVVVAVVKL